MFPDYVSDIVEKDLWSKKIGMIKFVREVADLGLVDAKNFVEWFIKNCTVEMMDWDKIRLMASLAARVKNGSLIVESIDFAYSVRLLTVEQLREEYNLFVILPDRVVVKQKVQYSFCKS